VDASAEKGVATTQLTRRIMIDRTVDAAPVIACSRRECVGETILVLFNAAPGD
jgi:hypothetical protein